MKTQYVEERGGKVDEKKRSNRFVRLRGQSVFQIAVFESKFGFDALIPSGFEIKVHVSSLLIFVRCDFRLVVTLKPRSILCVKSPTLLLQLLCGEILSICTLLVVKYEKQGVRFELGVELRVVERGHGDGWKMRIQSARWQGVQRNVLSKRH